MSKKWDTCRGGIPIANVEMLRQYEESQILRENGVVNWISNYSYWWGKMDCFGGGDEDWMLNLMKASKSSADKLASYLGIPKGVISYYLSVMIKTGEWCNTYRGYFCIVYTYVGVMYVTCG